MPGIACPRFAMRNTGTRTSGPAWAITTPTGTPMAATRANETPEMKMC